MSDVSRPDVSRPDVPLVTTPDPAPAPPVAAVDSVDDPAPEPFVAVVPAPRRSRRFLWLALGLLGLLVTIGVLGNTLGWFGNEETGTAVEIVGVETRALEQTVTASGRVEPETEVKISPEIPGELIELRVREGDEVVAGQVLARIRAEQYDAQVSQLEASIAQAEAGVGQASAGIGQAGAAIGTAQAGVAQAEAQAEAAGAAVAQAEAQLARLNADLERQRRLLERGVIPGAEVDNLETQVRVQRAAVASARANAQSARQGVASARQQVESARANAQSARAGAQGSRSSVAGAQARLREVNEQRAKTTIVAPISGTVSQLNVEAGERVVGTSQMAGTELMRIARLDEMELVVDVNENDIVNVQVGDSARVEVDAFPGRALTGIVTEISQSSQSMRGAAAAQAGATGTVTNFRVKVRVVDLDGASARAGGALSPEGGRTAGAVRLRPGMNGTVDIRTNRVGRAIAVPIGAVTVRDMNAMREAQQAAASGQRRSRSARSASTPANANDPSRSGLPKVEDLQKVVFVVRDGRAVAVPVTTGIDDRTYVQVLSGLRAGDRVVVGPYGLVSRELKSGDRVRQSNDD